MDVSILEWNIHQQGGWGQGLIPKWVLDEVIVNQDKAIANRIIVLTEFCTKCAGGKVSVCNSEKVDRENFIKGLEKADYQCIASENPQGNDILIAVKKPCRIIDQSPNWKPCYDPLNLLSFPYIPENLRVDIDCGGRILTVVGIRIRSFWRRGRQINVDRLRRKEFLWALDWIKDINNPIIITGDFNNNRRHVENKFDKEKRLQDDRWSMMQIDHMLPPGFTRITPSGGSIFEAEKPFGYQFAEDHFIIKEIQGVTLFPYDRSFTERDSKIYSAGKNLNEIPAGYPDHAILRGIFSLNDAASPADQ